MEPKMHSLLLRFWLVLALISAQAAIAQSYPSKPIRIVIGFPPGTLIDGTARPLSEVLQKTLGVPIVLDFKPGAAATIAAKYVAGSEPDGYTIFYGNTVNMDPAFMENNAVVARKELAPVSVI